jgi:hypothetical protein
MVQKQIELIRNQIIKLEEKEFDLDAWKSSTSVILGSIFNDNYQGVKAIDKIKFDSGGWAIGDASHFWDNIVSCKKQGKEILEACIVELETFGLPELYSCKIFVIKTLGCEQDAAGNMPSWSLVFIKFCSACARA